MATESPRFRVQQAIKEAFSYAPELGPTENDRMPYPLPEPEVFNTPGHQQNPLVTDYSGPRHPISGEFLRKDYNKYDYPLHVYTDPHNSKEVFYVSKFIVAAPRLYEKDILRDYNSQHKPFVPVGEYGLQFANNLIMSAWLLDRKIAAQMQAHESNKDTKEKLDSAFYYMMRLPTITSKGFSKLMYQGVSSVTEAIALGGINKIAKLKETEYMTEAEYMKQITGPHVKLLQRLSQKLPFGHEGGMGRAQRVGFPPHPLELDKQGELHFSERWEEMFAGVAAWKKDPQAVREHGGVFDIEQNAEIIGHGCPGAFMIPTVASALYEWYQWYEEYKKAHGIIEV